MGAKDHCAVPACSNDRRKPESYIIKPHVSILKFHRPKLNECEAWNDAVRRKRYVITGNSRICSNHFKNGAPTKTDSIPSLYLTVCII